jgi:5-hydroxyisourate hydrolase
VSHVTTHVLDAALGRPASGVPVSLHDVDGGLLATGATNEDGRVASLGPDLLKPGVYTIVFDTAVYFAMIDTASFYPNVTITFEITDGSHYHVPLLLSPFAYSTYRGS